MSDDEQAWTVEWCFDTTARDAREAADLAADVLMARDHTLTSVAVSNRHGMTVWRELFGVDDATMLMPDPVWVPSPLMVADLAAWMHTNDWPVSEIIEMLYKPKKYAAEYTAMILEREFDKVATGPEELEEDAEGADAIDVSSVTVRAVFRPEAWVDDHAVEVDVDWDQKDWIVTSVTAATIARQMWAHSAGLGSLDLDWVRDDPKAPRWIKEWSGPFTITIE